ncbi:MAG TPA: LacI family transcriptional regulator [Chloroflexi bacterium]|nr:LacI family transcriptional regulator [Chloroflexota bacterium]
MPATLKDIAHKVGYSVTTVSRALAGYDDVAESTRQLILETAAEMGYRPDATARRLRKRRTDTIGFIIPTHGPRFSDPFFSELLAGIGNEAARQELDLLVSTRAPGAEELKIYERMVLERRVDGLLVVRTRRQDLRIAYLVEQGFPFVAFGRSDLEADFPYLDVDGKEGLWRLTQHLIDLGHRRIGYISAPLDLMFACHRLEGHREALAASGIPFDDTLVVVGELTERSGYQAGSELLARDDRPTAIIACNDLMALGVISAAQGMGLRVGRDVAVAGFDDIPLAEHAQPPLTTVRQPIYEIGRRVCAMLIQLLREGILEERHVLLQPQLIVRESCGANDLNRSERR